MRWQCKELQQICIGSAKLECRCWGPAPADAPTLVLLHEGLGSVNLWKNFPSRLTKQTGYGVFAYSRAGYGGSDPVPLPRPLDYMTREAEISLPDVLDAIGFQQGVLIGHSDGASIAAIYAGSVDDRRIRGICLISPHFFTEERGLASIADAKIAYEKTDLRTRMAKHHKDPDNAFRGWNDAWLAPGFREWNIEEFITYMRVPVLAIQGRDDQYGTLAQIEALQSRLFSPLEIEVLDDCKHSPHIEQSEKTVTAIADFVSRITRIEAS